MPNMHGIVVKSYNIMAVRFSTVYSIRGMLELIVKFLQTACHVYGFMHVCTGKYLVHMYNTIIMHVLCMFQLFFYGHAHESILKYWSVIGSHHLSQQEHSLRLNVFWVYMHAFVCMHKIICARDIRSLLCTCVCLCIPCSCNF